jgi:hypothetical protein
VHTLRWFYGKTWRIPDKLRMNLSYKLVNSPVGVLKLVASEKDLVAVLWENDDPRRVRLSDLRPGLL